MNPEAFREAVLAAYRKKPKPQVRKPVPPPTYSSRRHEINNLQRANYERIKRLVNSINLTSIEKKQTEIINHIKKVLQNYRHIKNYNKHILPNNNRITKEKIIDMFNARHRNKDRENIIKYLDVVNKKLNKIKQMNERNMRNKLFRAHTLMISKQPRNRYSK